MKHIRMSRGGAALSAAAVLLSALGLGAATASTASAASAGWCNGRTYITFPSGAKGYVPTYNGKTNCTMSEGASGIEVETLQRTLVKCYNQPIDIDGIFGPATKKHLGYAQNMTYPDLVGDGIYGPETAKYLSHYAVKDGKQHCSPQVS